MDSNKRRSTLRKSIVDVGARTDAKSQQKRRISFSGKNSVRVFHGEEEPQTWNNSYEISDHLNIDETTSNLCALPTTKSRSAGKNLEEHKENFDQSVIKNKILKVHSNQPQKNPVNVSINSPLSLTKELINISYQNQSSKIYQIENSVDITLCEREKKFQVGKVKSTSQTTNLYSFSLEDHEAEDRSTMPCERTIDFMMRESANDTSIVKRQGNGECTFTNEKGVKDKFQDITSNEEIPVTVYMSNSLSISGNEHVSSANINAHKENDISQESRMQISLNTAKQCDKENVNPFSAQNSNETQNNSFEMEIEDEILSHYQTDTVNVEIESTAFQDKLNQLSFVQESDDNKKACNISNYADVNLNNQPRSISNSFQLANKNSEKNISILNFRYRPTVNFNKTIEFSPNKSTKKSEEIDLNINFNQSAEGGTQNAADGENKIHATISKVKLRHTLNFNKTIEISPPKLNANLPKKTVNLKEDEHVSPVKLSHEYLSDNNLDAHGSIRKYGQPPKIVVRKICTPIVNKTKNSIDLEQQRLARYKKKQEQKLPLNSALDKAAGPIETENLTEKSINFSLDSVKNISLESDCSSPLIPLEFKGYSLRQLNDEIECGKIKVFSNAPKIATTDGKKRISALNFYSNNVQLTQSTTKHEKTLLFKDADITLSSEKTLHTNLETAKSKNFFDFNITQGEAKERKGIGECRYSEAYDMMLDNTSFLTKAKVSDETVSCNNSKINLLQMYGIMDSFDESLMNAASKRETNISGLRSQTGNSCDKESIENAALLQNVSQRIEANVQAEKSDKNKHNSIPARKTLYFNDEIPLKEELITLDQQNIQAEKCTDYQNPNTVRKTIYLNNEICELEETLLAADQKASQSRKSVLTAQEMDLTLNEDLSEITSKTDICLLNSNPKRHTLFLNDEIPLDKPSMIIVENIQADFNNKIPTQKDSITIEQIPLEKTPNIIARKAEKTYFNNDISLENTSKKITENIQAEKSDTCINYENKTRKTLYFTNEIPLDSESETYYSDAHNLNKRKTLYFNNEICELDETLQAVDKKISQSKKSVHITQDMNVTFNGDKSEIFKTNYPYSSKEELIDITDIDTCNLTPTRKTYYSNDISLENTSKKTTETIQAEKNDTGINYENKTRKSFYVTNEIPLESEPFTFDRKNTQAETYYSDAQHLNKRKTFYFDNEVCELEETLQAVDQKISQSKKSVRITEDMNVTFNGDKSEIIKTDYPYSSKEELIDITVGAVKINKCDVNKLSADKTKLSIDGKSIYTPACMDLKLDGEELNKSSKYDDLHMMNFTLDENVDECKNDDRKTLFYEMSIAESLKTPEKCKLPEPTEHLNAAKMTMARQISGNYLANISKSTNKQENLLMTPRLSLLEFKALEQEAIDGERLQSIKYISPLGTENCNKRQPANLTPLFSIPKRRQRLISTIEGNSKDNLPKEKLSDMEQIKNKANPEHINQCAANDDAVKISVIAANESVLQTPPKERKSRIPIPFNSGNKSLILNHTTSNINKEIQFGVDMENDNLTESIQLMRRATTFTQRRDSTIAQLELDGECEPAGKPSIFEGNPITISDVSVFFEAHKKATSDIQQTEMGLGLEKTNTNIPNTAETAAKNSENRYINLTLEDIDKTRLSLVRLSYEDGTCLEQEENGTDGQLLQNHAVISEKVENNVDFKSKHRNINYLRNVSLVCRKCKRCQETLINESSSSTSEASTLSELPPLPDIGLNHLRRLRKLSTTADVNSLWQRVSLERTIINYFNISDDEKKIIRNIDDNAEDKESDVTKIIRKYKKDMISFEMDLLEKHQYKLSSEKLSFVLRLNDLLRANSTNWIFDYQMQYRGILLFSHRKMYTFTLSLAYDEVDPLGCEISLKSVKLEKGHIPKKNWTPIDYFLDFQFNLNLPFNLKWVCKGSDEDSMLKMLQEIDRVCLDTVKMGNCLLRICFMNQAYIKRDECRTYIYKSIRKIVYSPNNDFKYVEKTEIKIELLNLKTLSFKDIFLPGLHHFREEIHLLPSGLQFLQEFLPNPLNYLKGHLL